MTRLRIAPGDRVYAILSADENEVQLLGFGTYVGDETPPRPEGFVKALYNGAETWEDVERIAIADGVCDESNKHLMRVKNPKLQLDDGRVVWGMECWWGPEKSYPDFRGKRRESRV